MFPSTEAVLLEARAGAFAGCISATANLNADLCARAWRNGDKAALDAAVAIRKLFDGKPLVSGVKALLAHIHGDPALARVKPPLGAVLGRRPRRGRRRLRRGAGQTGGLIVGISAALTPARALTISLARGGERLAAAFSCKDQSIAAGFPPQASVVNERLMANTKSARKATRKIARRTEVNKARRSVLRNSVRKVEEAIASGDRNAALAAFKEAEPVIMRAAQRGVVHKNNASRKVSRLAHRIAKLAK